MNSVLLLRSSDVMGPLLRLIRFPKMVSILGTAPYRNCANDLPATQHKQRHRLALRQPRHVSTLTTMLRFRLPYSTSHILKRLLIM